MNSDQPAFSRHHFGFQSCGFTTYITLGLLATSLISGCGPWGNHVVKVKVINTDTDPTHKLTEVKVLEGGEKYIWHTMISGRVASVTLIPDSSAPRQLTLSYIMNGKTIEWKGPGFKPDTGYSIELKIDAHGAVTERHCLLPCELK